MDFLKAEPIGSAKWRVCAIPFGGEFKGGKDLDGEFFSPRTDIKADWFDRRPVLFHHGLDDSLKTEDIGEQRDLVKEDDGWWGQIWLNRAHRYHAQIERLLQAGKMYGSSGSAVNLVKKASNGEILVWPHLEQSLTPTPANRLARVTAAKALADFHSAGIELDPALKGLLAELDELSTDLTSDLPSGGGDSAASRLSSTLDRLDEVLKALA